MQLAGFFNEKSTGNGRNTPAVTALRVVRFATTLWTRFATDSVSS